MIAFYHANRIIPQSAFARPLTWHATKKTVFAQCIAFLHKHMLLWEHLYDWYTFIYSMCSLLLFGGKGELTGSIIFTRGLFHMKSLNIYPLFVLQYYHFQIATASPSRLTTSLFNFVLRVPGISDLCCEIMATDALSPLCSVLSVVTICHK